MSNKKELGMAAFGEYPQPKTTFTQAELNAISTIKSLELRVIDLDKKLNQAIDLLSIEQRAVLLSQWAKQN